MQLGQPTIVVNASSPPQNHEQQQWLTRTQLSLEQLETHYQQLPLDAQVALQEQSVTLKGLQQKLAQALVQVAVFGFVSRGKSAVLNALFTDPVFPVGPLNGKTQWPRAVRWSLAGSSADPDPLQIELIDTPGLDEIEGESRAQMARTVAATADLILFIVAGVPTAAELEALVLLHQMGRPLLLVVNKADLYPDLTPHTIYEQLPEPVRQSVSPEDILLIAAAPAPQQVLNQWADGRSEMTWETRPPQVELLRQRLLQFFHEESRAVLVLNVLAQMGAIATQLTQQRVTQQAPETDRLIFKFLSIKAILLVIVPFFWIDVPIATVVDVLLIGAMSRHLDLPTPPHQVQRLWGALLLSVVCLGTAELVGLLLFGANDAALFHELGLRWSLGSRAVVQASLAAYGLIRVGAVTQTYLVQGLNWGPLGANTLRQHILKTLQPSTLAARVYRNFLINT